LVPVPYVIDRTYVPVPGTGTGTVDLICGACLIFNGDHRASHADAILRTVVERHDIQEITEKYLSMRFAAFKH